MIDRETSFFESVVSENICVDICYDGLLLVDGREVCNIFDVVRNMNNRVLDEIDELNKQ